MFTNVMAGAESATCCCRSQQVFWAPMRRFVTLAGHAKSNLVDSSMSMCEQKAFVLLDIGDEDA